MSEEFEKPEIREVGRDPGGQPIYSDHRLYMQVLAFGNVQDVEALKQALADSDMDAALYADINDPHGVGLVTMSDDPDFFVHQLREFLQTPPFVDLNFKAEYTMFGRSYAIGYEHDLEQVLYNRPRSRALDAEYPWVVWYPLRRSGAFALLDRKEQMGILGEHGAIGRTYGEAEYAQDIRLACHGLDKNDNDFVVGLIGKELMPLSHLVQRMRSTQQTSKYLVSLGPFFVGKAIYQSPA